MSIDESNWIPRWQAESIQLAMSERRVVLLTGPRQCGKSSLAIRIPNARYLTLDDTTIREAAELDPHSFVKRDGRPLIIDEIQRVPNLLIAIKKAVDEDPTPGQYLLTGSANIQSLPSSRESLAGRVAKIRLRPLCFGEYQRTSPTFFTQILNEQFSQLAPANNAQTGSIDRDTIIEQAFQGGFPEITKLSLGARKRWHKDYIEALLERDLRDISKIQRVDAMRALIDITAAWSSKYMDVATICSGLSIHRNTIESYLNALEMLYLIEKIPPWIKTDYQRVGKQKKLFMTDTGLMSSILGWQPKQVALDSDRLGKLIETWVANQLCALIDAAHTELEEYTLYHYRDRTKREIDFIIERDDGAIIGVEVKASTQAVGKDFKHLTWFRDNIAGERTFVGIVMYAGNQSLSFGDGLWAIPFSCLGS